MSRGKDIIKEARKKMPEFCIDCEFTYIDDDGNIYCDCIEDGDYGDCAYEEEDFEDCPYEEEDFEDF